MMTSDSARPHGKNAFFFVIVTVALDMMAFGLIIPVIPTLIQDLAGVPPENATLWIGALAGTYALFNFFAGPVLGALSDRFGRRPVLLGSIAMLSLDFLIMGLSTTLAILFLGRALSGIGGATVATANAYIADTTEPKDRAKAFGKIGAAFGFGFVFGPVLGGLLGEVDPRMPFFVAAALAGVNFLYGLLVLPESLAPENRRPIQLARANPFGAARHFSKLPQVSWLLIAGGAYFFAHTVFPATWAIHGEIRYDWTPREIGLSLGLVGLGASLVQALMMGPMIKRFGPVRTATFGLCTHVVTMAAYAFAFTPWMALLIIPFNALGGVATPAINSLMSTVTPRNAQGELQGATASLNALAMIFGPLTMNAVLYFATHAGSSIQFPGAAFLLASAITALVLIPFFRGVKANSAALAAADAA
ncbi:TCR/Tet family MFS transporter [Hyphomonas sp.]|uniref:TCR/Tet family MFS transporter n=1 Tax=Hyphomonas sp. TaxID=87 RepID=UPI0025C6F238|nr:TCR/Tet family MFS transporter [Hyphomonas sp.]MBI1401305.1 MFS transporter [Hyphomonas sp.]